MGLGGVVVTALSIYAYHEGMWGASYSTGLENGVIVQVLAGVGTNENILAYTLSLSTAATLAAGLPRQSFARAAWLLVLSANAYGLYLAQSGTGFLTILTVLLVFTLTFAWPQMRSKRRRSIMLFTTGSAGVLVIGLGLVVLGLDKDVSTFSGRAPFWRATWEATLDRSPFLGSGWGAVWPHPWSMVPPNAVAEDIYARAGYPLSHGHNFFLDVLPELGLIGVTLALLMVAYAAREVGRSGLMKGAPDPLTGRFTLFVVTSLLVFGITEPMFTVPLGWWSLTLVVALSRQRVLGTSTDEGSTRRRRMAMLRATTHRPEGHPAGLRAPA
jgi:O-antigen ligase